MKKIIPALCLLLVSAVVMATASFAWFSMNTEVTATGMQVKATASDNLLISNTIEEKDFQGGQITQEQKAILEPVSTVNGKDFFYTTNAKADGDAKEEAYTAYVAGAAALGEDAANYDSAFSQAYGLTKTAARAIFPDIDPAIEGAVGYVDYTFYLKAISSAENQKINMSACTLKYGEEGTLKDAAMRVAVFATEAKATATEAKDVSNDAIPLVSILKTENSKNQSNVVAPDSTQAVNSESTLADVIYNNAAVIDADLGVETAYYKVIVRLYIEGEDTTCTNDTFAKLTDAWTLEVAFSLNDAAVNKISNSDTSSTN